MTVLLYSRRKGWQVDGVTVECSHRRVSRTGGESGAGHEEIRSRITIEGDLSDDQRDRLLQIAGRCPIHRTLESKPRMIEEIEVVRREEQQ